MDVDQEAPGSPSEPAPNGARVGAKSGRREDDDDSEDDIVVLSSATAAPNKRQRAEGLISNAQMQNTVSTQCDRLYGAKVELLKYPEVVKATETAYACNFAHVADIERIQSAADLWLQKKLASFSESSSPLHGRPPDGTS